MTKKLTRSILLVEGGAQDADLRYACGFTAPDPVVLLVHGAEKHLVVSLLEVGRAVRTAQVTKVWTPQELNIPRPQRGNLATWAAALLKKVGAKKVSVNATFPVGIADALRKARFTLNVEPGGLFPERRTKTAAEIAHITQSQRAAVAAMKAAIARIKNSRVRKDGKLVWDGELLTSENVRQLIERVLLEYDAQAMDTIVAGGEQGAEPHERGYGPLRAHELIVIDIFPRNKLSGYWGDITRTVVKGKAAPPLKKMVRAVKQAHKAALDTVRAGVKVKQVHGAAQEALVRNGFETTFKEGRGEGFIHSTGHGVGLDIHEAPGVNLSDTKLLAGDVITIEPGLYYKAWGGVRIEDTIVVTPTGYSLLASCPYTLEI